MKLIEFGFFIFLVQQWTQDSFFVSGNYQIALMEFEGIVKNATKYINTDGIKLKRKSHNTTHKFYGSIIIFDDVTKQNDLRLVVELYKKQGGEYRKTAFHLKGMGCAILEIDNVFSPSLNKATGISKNVILSYISRCSRV